MRLLASLGNQVAPASEAYVRLTQKENEMNKPSPVRKTISSNIHAEKVYPGIHSIRAATAKYVNLVFEASEAEALGHSLLRAGSGAKELTIRAARTPAAKTSKHGVTVTYETRMKKP